MGAGVVNPTPVDKAAGPIEVGEAQRIILKNITAVGPETVSLAAAAGRIVYSGIRAARDLPLFDNSTMDGYAVRTIDLRRAEIDRPVRLEVRQTLAAGASRAPRRVNPGQAARIMTGAPLPPGADAVVMQEQGDRVNGHVLIRRRPQFGEWVRTRGEDVRAGETIIRVGTRLRPYELALLAAQGISGVEVFRRPVVAVLSTGDELFDGAYRKLPAGRIWDANRPAILGALGLWGFKAIDLGVSPDAPRAIAAKLRAGLARADAVVVSGGVSVGEFDFTREVFSKVRVETIFWKVRIKPGKPFLFGLRRGGRAAPQPVFGIPGNPVSSLVCMEELIRPALDRMQGALPSMPPYRLQGRALNGFELPANRRQYLFCEAAASGKNFSLRILRPQASHRVGMCAKANALACPPEGMTRVRPGDLLPFRWLE